MHDETSGLATLRFGLWTKVLHPASVMSTSNRIHKAGNTSSFTTFYSTLMRSFLRLTISSTKTMKCWTCPSVGIRISQPALATRHPSRFCTLVMVFCHESESNKRLRPGKAKWKRLIGRDQYIFIYIYSTHPLESQRNMEILYNGS